MTRTAGHFKRGDMRTVKDDILTFLFWANFGAFSLHVLDETLMAGGFVAGVQVHLWPAYTATKFFTVNASFLVLIAISNLFYDWQGSRLAVIPYDMGMGTVFKWPVAYRVDSLLQGVFPRSCDKQHVLCDPLSLMSLWCAEGAHAESLILRRGYYCSRLRNLATVFSLVG